MWKNTSPTRSLAKHCLAALAWSQTAVSGKVTLYVQYELSCVYSKCRLL